MGLDMYLEAELYVGGYDFCPEEERNLYRNLLEQAELSEFACSSSQHAKVTTCVAYWRKANAIHGWFVENVQGGEDNCQRTYVPQETLIELIDACKLAQEAFDRGDFDAAGEILPPQSGFFFGSTEIDDWYRNDLGLTVSQLEPLLKLDVKYSLYYQASW